MSSASTTATFCATLVDEWIRSGITDAVVAPGSRSTPLALAMAARSELTVHVAHDERVASFMALGVGLASGRPAVLLCTSGTAAAHFHAAIVEAHQSHVPMIVCTADRPPELRETGAPQTIDQTHLYGAAVRWFHDPGVPDIAAAPSWRGLASRAVLDATYPDPGPVHLNLPFREPLLGDCDVLPSPRDLGPWTASSAWRSRPDEADVHGLVRLLDRQRGVIVAGRDANGYDEGLVHALAAELQWPVLADPRSGARTPASTVIAAADAMLRHERFAADHAPEVVLRIGEPPASKVLAQWLAAACAVELQLTSVPGWIDPGRALRHRLVGDIDSVLTALRGQLRGAAGTPWLARWRRAEQRTQMVFDELLGGTVSEPAVARRLAAVLPNGSTLVVSSSMPVRDVEWYVAPRAGFRVVSNRGANGIDGVLSTAIGVALATAAPTAVLIGDVALLHDSSAFTALRRRPVDLTIVVIDNDGGGIFSFLPQAGIVAAERFETLFGTPHGTDLVALALAHGIPATDVGRLDEIDGVVDGVRMVRVRTDRRANVAEHDRIHRAVAAAL